MASCSSSPNLLCKYIALKMKFCGPRPVIVRGRKLCRRLFFYILYKSLHYEVSHARCSREVTAKKCTKTFDAPRAEWLLLLRLCLQYTGWLSVSRYEKIWYSVNTSPICESPALKIGAGQILSVTEIAPKSRFLCVNGSAIAIRHSVTLALV